jgi:solute carrier family 25 aspartate/glutamate transporter 12/13
VIELLPTLSALSPGGRISFSEVVACHNVIRGMFHGINPRSIANEVGSTLCNLSEMDIIERLLREATAKSKDGRIDQSEFLNHAASSSRYSLFTPMETTIVFHFAGRGTAGQRLALIDFAQLLDPRWRAPGDVERAAAVEATAGTTASTLLANLAESAYNFVQGGEHILRHPIG